MAKLFGGSLELRILGFVERITIARSAHQTLKPFRTGRFLKGVIDGC